MHLDRARQSPIEARVPNDEDHSRVGKAEEEDRLGKVAACPNAQNLIGRGIYQIVNEKPDPKTSRIGRVVMFRARKKRRASNI
jgi:hypothetical protein